MTEQDVKFFVPITDVKKSASQDSKEAKCIVSGLASSGARDFQGESIDPIGIDDSYFKSQGWIDFEHTDTIIGIPTDNTYVDPEKGLYVEAELFENMPEVQDLLGLTENLKRIGSNRKLGFSIEGQIQERDSEDPTIIRSIIITGLAITKNPANPEATWDVVQKNLQSKAIASKVLEMMAETKKSTDTEPVKKDFGALEAGYGVSPETQVDGGALKVEALLGSIKNLAYAMSNEKLDTLAGDVIEAINNDGSLTNIEDEVDTLFLQIFGGVSRTDAKDILSEEENIKNES